jgi:hypothetical protein
MGRTTVPITFHGSKHPVLGASTRRPILVYQAATSEGELRRIPLPKLSEKRSERAFEGGFGRYEEAEMGPIEPSRQSVGLRRRCFQGFSDCFSTRLGE